jgi:hypothetical protein
MTAALALLEDLQQRGAMVTAEESTLYVEPRGILTDELRASIQQLKPALLEFLTHPPLMQELLKLHPQLNNPADVAELQRYFSELPLLPDHTDVYPDELYQGHTGEQST